MTTDKQKNKEQEERKYLNCFLKSSCCEQQVKPALCRFDTLFLEP